jgi:hypothetical protein
LGFSNLAAWWKADALSLGNVTAWTTSYPTGGSAVTLSDGSAPYSTATNTPTASIFNYNAMVDFNGNSGTSQRQLSNTSALNLLTNQSTGNTGTFFVVFASPTSGANDGVVTYKNYPDGIQMRAWGRLAIGHNTSTNGTRNFTPNPVEKPLIISYKGNKSSGTSMTAFRNDLVYTTSSSSSALMSNGITFGAKRNTTTSYNEYFSGYISEVIFYNADLSNANINMVKTYLAIKYGTTLDNIGGGAQGDYVGTDGTTIWDASFSAGYHNDVIGIGRDDSEGLLQKQSHTFDDVTRIYVGALAANNSGNAASISSNSSYVTVGHNTDAMCATVASNVEMPAGLVNCTLYSRLEREWKVTKTNFGQVFNADLTLDACANLGSVNPAELRLLVDDDGNFSNGGTTCYYNGDGTGIVLSYSGPVVTVSNIGNTHIANNSTRFITLGSVINTTPLPVTLSGFNVANENCYTQVDWVTASESDTKDFIVEKSIDLSEWEQLCTLEANGYSTSPISYSCTDELPTSGINYYRLKQRDIDGTITTYDFRSVEVNCKNFDPIIYPNPTNGSLSVESPLRGTVSILDIQGKLIVEKDLEVGNNGLDLTNISHLECTSHQSNLLIIQSRSSDF